MNKELERLNGIPFQSYVGDNFPFYSDTSYGQLIIVDNTGSENINGLVPNTYNVFIDHIHIASGYGFSSAEELTEQINKLSWCEEQINTLSQNTDEDENILNNLFNLQINDTQNINHFGSYNSYGFETSYVNFSISTSITENSKTHYLNINKYDLNYINPIEIKYTETTIIDPDNPDDEGIIEEITKVYKTDRFPLNIKLTSSSPENANLLKNKYDVKLNNETIIENYLNETNIGSNYKEYTIGYDSDDIYEKNLTVEYIFKKSENDNIFLSSYTIPKLLKWCEIVVNYPTTELINNSTIGVCEEDEDIKEKIGNNLFRKYKNQNSYYLPNKLFDLTFNSGENFLHDYVITSSQNNIEFYYNGIKSNNWEVTTINDYNIWKSPQKYSGERIWQIKINTINNINNE